VKKRVLMLSTVHLSGATRYHAKLATTLDDAGYDLEVWSQGINRPGFLPKTIKVFLIGMPGKIERMIYLPRALNRALFGGHDLIIVVPPETVPLGLVAKLFGKKILWDVEENAVETILISDWIPERFRSIISKTYHCFEKLGTIFFDGITYAEDSYASRFEKAKLKQVIHNFPFNPNGNKRTWRRIAEARWKQSGPRLIYVGVITSHHGIDETILAIKLLEDRLPDIQFDVLGDIQCSKHKRRLKQLIGELKKPARVTLHGRIQFTKLQGYFKKAQIALFPLYDEPNFACSEGTKLFEYGLSGLPMVVGDLPIWRSMLDKADAGETAIPADPESWADSIYRLWSRGPDELQAAGKRLNDLIYERNAFWENEAIKLLRICNDILH